MLEDLGLCRVYRCVVCGLNMNDRNPHGLQRVPRPPVDASGSSGCWGLGERPGFKITLNPKR